VPQFRTAAPQKYLPKQQSLKPRTPTRIQTTWATLDEEAASSKDSSYALLRGLTPTAAVSLPINVKFRT